MRYQPTIRHIMAVGDRPGHSRDWVHTADMVTNCALDAVRTDYNVCLVRGSIQEVHKHALWIYRRMSHRCASFVELHDPGIHLADKRVKEYGPMSAELMTL